MGTSLVYSMVYFVENKKNILKNIKIKINIYKM